MASSASLVRISSTENMHGNVIGAPSGNSNKQKQLKEARLRKNAYNLEEGGPTPKNLNTMNSDLAEVRVLNIAANANKKVIRSSRMALKNN